jgi:hypothetical protein
MNKIVATIMISVSFGSSLSFADQFQVVPLDIAKKAGEILQKKKKLIEYCEPCQIPAGKNRCKSMENITVSASKWNNSNSDYEVVINGKEKIDLAYTYVYDQNKWENLAIMLGLNPSDVPKVLDLGKCNQKEEIKSNSPEKIYFKNDGSVDNSVPVTVTFRKALLGPGYVAVLTKKDPKESFLAKVTVKKAGIDAAVSVIARMDTPLAKEVGHSQGVAIDVGDVITITNDKYQPLVVNFNGIEKKK